MTSENPTLPRILHCFEDGPETEDGCATTCMLEAGHEGPHEWTRDDWIKIMFFEKPS